MCDHCGCRAFGPIAEFTEEHEQILSLAWDVAQATRRGEVPDPVTLDALLRLLDTHVAIEETGLYPLLVGEDALASSASDAFEEEHRELHGALLDGRFDRREYFALAAHIEDEEMELFPAAMFTFDDQTWGELAAVRRRCAERLSSVTT